jgi:choline dehydrogenase-like flavoprotein
MQYDVVIIGAGFAGAILATRLSEDPQRSVLLLEAGPDYPHFEHLPEEVQYGYATKIDIMTSSHNWQFIGKVTDTALQMLVPHGSACLGRHGTGRYNPAYAACHDGLMCTIPLQPCIGQYSARCYDPGRATCQAGQVRGRVRR